MLAQSSPLESLLAAGQIYYLSHGYDRVGTPAVGIFIGHARGILRSKRNDWVEKVVCPAMEKLGWEATLGFKKDTVVIHNPGSVFRVLHAFATTMGGDAYALSIWGYERHDGTDEYAEKFDFKVESRR